MSSLAAFFFFALAAQAAPESGGWKCAEGKLRAGGRQEASTYCHRPLPNQLLSKGCFEGHCELIERIRKAPEETFSVELTGFGNPDYRLCRKLGGTPRSVEFLDGGKWKVQVECRIGKDGSFASLDFLQFAAKRYHPSLQENEFF